jgi:HEPN domain-containing protein
LKRQDLRDLALLRVKEAQVLLNNSCWPGTYYLAGYAVECALKACIARETERYDFPDRARVNSSYTHSLVTLVRVANLHAALRDAMDRQPELASNWNAVREWSEESRYERRSEADATTLLNAVKDRRNGVLAWLKKHW